MTGNQPDRVGRCPWCGESVRTDARRLDGGRDAMAHVSRCIVLREIKHATPTPKEEPT